MIEQHEHGDLVAIARQGAREPKFHRIIQVQLGLLRQLHDERRGERFGDAGDTNLRIHYHCPAGVQIRLASRSNPGSFRGLHGHDRSGYAFIAHGTV